MKIEELHYENFFLRLDENLIDPSLINRIEENKIMNDNMING